MKRALKKLVFVEPKSTRSPRSGSWREAYRSAGAAEGLWEAA